jgi:competence protein ComEA
MPKKNIGIIFKIADVAMAILLAWSILTGTCVTGTAHAKKGQEQKPAVALIDINSASEKELEGLKGVGSATAKKIIANRPYKTVDELSKAGLKASAIEAIKPFVTVGKAQTMPATAAAAKVSTAASTKAADIQKTAGALIDINSASEKELEGLKGVGSATAKKIVANRPYKTVDELSKAGLKANTIEALKPFVTVGKAEVSKASQTATTTATKAMAPVATDLSKASQDVKAAGKTVSTAAKLAPGTKININTADQAMLEKLPEIGPVKAKAIIDGRPYQKIEDIMKVSGIKEKTFEAIKDYIVVK